MKKIIYITFTFIVMILFNIELDALVCTYYIDPNDTSKEIVIDFSKDLHKAYLNKKETESCINTNTSTFKEIHLHNQTEGGKTNYFEYANKKWLFKKDYFESTTCYMNIFTYEEDANGNPLMKCPSLGYYERDGYTYLTNKSKDPVCNNPGECTNIVVKENIIESVDKDGNIIENDYNKTCNYTLDLTYNNNKNNKKASISQLTITESPKGSLYASIDGSELTKINTTGEYAFNILSKDRLDYISMKREYISEFLLLSSPDEGYGLMCKSTPSYVYYDNDVNKYLIVPNKEDIPEGIVDYTAFGEYGDNNPLFGQLISGTVSDEIGFCTSYLGNINTDGSMAQYLDVIYTIIKIVSILITIVWSMLDMSKVIIHNKDELMATVKKIVIRLIILLVILLLPTFIDIIGDLFGVEDILCGIK